MAFHVPNRTECAVNTLGDMRSVVYNRRMEFNFLLGVRVIYFMDKTLFKISNLVLGGETIVMDSYSSLEGQRGWECDTGTQTERDGVIETEGERQKGEESEKTSKT
jgi:hypothetical protein